MGAQPASGAQPISFCHVGAQGSDPRNDVSREVSVDPGDDARVDIGYLEQGRDLRVPGTAIDPNHISHPPGPIRVSDDHGHACFDVQKDGIRLWRCNGARMINRHIPLPNTPVLVRLAVPRNLRETLRLDLGHVLGHARFRARKNQVIAMV